MSRVNLTAMPDEEWARRLAESFRRAAETADPFTAKWYRREVREIRVQYERATETTGNRAVGDS